MISNASDSAGIVPGGLSHTRALDLLDQQRRRILDLSGLLSSGQRTVQHSTDSLSWRSPARSEFEMRLTDLHRILDHSAGALATALAECDRARDVVRATLAAEWSAAEKDFVGYPAGQLRR